VLIVSQTFLFRIYLNTELCCLRSLRYVFIFSFFANKTRIHTVYDSSAPSLNHMTAVRGITDQKICILGPVQCTPPQRTEIKFHIYIPFYITRISHELRVLRDCISCELWALWSVMVCSSLFISDGRF